MSWRLGDGAGIPLARVRLDGGGTRPWATIPAAW